MSISLRKYQIFLLLIAFCFACAAGAIAQVPQNIPNENVPTDWTSWSAKFWYIIMPIAIIILYVAGRRRWKKPSDRP
jgi:TRAP-type C4-dicarboxylate transport system permease small subunit